MASKDSAPYISSQTAQDQTSTGKLVEFVYLKATSDVPSYRAPPTFKEEAS